MANTLKVGETRVGHLIDGKEHTPWLACTLAFDSTLGPVITIPFVYGQSQFTVVQRWYDHKATIPESLIFRDDRGGVVLSGLRSRSSGGYTYKYIQIMVAAVLLEEPVRALRRYRIGEMRSELDGLTKFVNPSAISAVRASESTIITIENRSRELIHWRHGGFTFALDVLAEPAASYDGLSYAIDTRTVIRSCTAKGATAEEHLAAQLPMKSLLNLLSGKAVYWRGHEVSDPKLPIYTLAGPTSHWEFIPAALARTAEDIQQPKSEQSLPTMTIKEVGSAGLQRWFKGCADPAFWRAIYPVSGMINQRRMLRELQVLTLASSLESLGHYLKPARRTIAGHIQHCINTVGGDWSAFGGSVLVAAAIGNTYNDLKHPDRRRPPSGTHLELVAQLALAIVRLVVFHTLGIQKRHRDDFLTHDPSMVWTRHTFTATGMVIQEDGKIVP